MISETNTTYQLCKTWTKRNKEIINIELKSIFHASVFSIFSENLGFQMNFNDNFALIGIDESFFVNC